MDDMAVLEESCVKIVLQGRKYLRKEYLHVQLRCIDFKCFVLVENPDCYFDLSKCSWKRHSDWQQSTDKANDKIPRINKAGIQ